MAPNIKPYSDSCRHFVRRLWGQGWCIDTIHSMATLLLQLAQKPGVGKDLEVALRERDFTSVRAALGVRRAIVETSGRGGGRNGRMKTRLLDVQGAVGVL